MSVICTVGVCASACGRSRSSHLATASSVVTTSTTSCPQPTTTSPPSSSVGPADERLHQPWATPGFSSDSQALADFRLDPAPANTRPRLADAQARSYATHNPGGAAANGPQTVVRFGLFTGNLVIVGADPNHTLQGSRRVVDQPAWIVATSGLDLNVGSSGPPPGPGAPRRPDPHARARPPARRSKSSAMPTAANLRTCPQATSRPSGRYRRVDYGPNRVSHGSGTYALGRRTRCCQNRTSFSRRERPNRIGRPTTDPQTHSPRLPNRSDTMVIGRPHLRHGNNSASSATHP